jgi:dihydroflavonol-4-reductase
MTKPWTLVTGASGFLGGRVVRALVERGVRVKAFVRPSSNLEPFRGLPESQLHLAFGDVLVEHTVYRALAGCDRLYHAASEVRWWSKRPSDILDPAEQGTRAVLSAAKKRGLERIVYTSSVAVLGASDDPTPRDEAHTLNLPDPELYVVAKQRAHAVAQAFAVDGLPLVTVMPGTALGPGDWKPTPGGALVVRYLNSTRRQLVMDGGVNLVDADDVALGHVLAMERGRVGESYVLGGENVSYEQAFLALSEITGLPAPGAKLGRGALEWVGRFAELGSRFTGRDPLMTARLARSYVGRYAWVTSEKAARELGYTHRPLMEILRRSARWFVDNGYVREPNARRLRLELRSAES